MSGEEEVFIAGEGGNTNDTFLRTGTDGDEEAFTRGRRQNPTRHETTRRPQKTQRGAETKIQQKKEHTREGPCSSDDAADGLNRERRGEGVDLESVLGGEDGALCLHVTGRLAVETSAGAKECLPISFDPRDGR